ncbi:hypothetical protein BU23DRAFT_150148 [Bimuria novae-zelandiae CBS 107.79]|uniref:Uncharacterized protein n=1 Tax=Bimuria novae-zelandiae CBS 107.79 TaxID=1447943 RepID=A0A6A5VWD6_9PLEO|nr:hypothetical protein BU23DRAFT_150148 [Bimuria novae-zelandiae CBS 107.79]
MACISSIGFAIAQTTVGGECPRFRHHFRRQRKGRTGESPFRPGRTHPVSHCSQWVKELNDNSIAQPEYCNSSTSIEPNCNGKGSQCLTTVGMSAWISAPRHDKGVTGLNEAQHLWYKRSTCFVCRSGPLTRSGTFLLRAL